MRVTSSVLSTIDSFQSLPSNVLDRLDAGSRRRTFRAGQRIIPRGDSEGSTFVMLSGRVEVHCWHPALTEPVVVGVFGRAVAIRQSAWLGRSITTVVLVAIEETQVLECDASVVQGLVSVDGGGARHADEGAGARGADERGDADALTASATETSAPIHCEDLD